VAHHDALRDQLVDRLVDVVDREVQDFD